MHEQYAEYEMGYTPNEFARVLSGNFSGEKSIYQCQSLGNDHWLLRSRESDLQIEVMIKAQPPRKLGLFTLPVLKVQFSVESPSAQLSQQFFDKFFKYFHKGGG